MKFIEDITLEDVGDVAITSIGPNNTITKRRVQMVVVAPRGKMVIVEPDLEYFDRGAASDAQCEAIKAFMDEHRHD